MKIHKSATHITQIISLSMTKRGFVFTESSAGNNGCSTSAGVSLNALESVAKLNNVAVMLVHEGFYIVLVCFHPFCCCSQARPDSFKMFYFVVAVSLSARFAPFQYGSLAPIYVGVQSKNLRGDVIRQNCQGCKFSVFEARNLFKSASPENQKRSAEGLFARKERSYILSHVPYFNQFQNHATGHKKCKIKLSIDALASFTGGNPERTHPCAHRSYGCDPICPFGDSQSTFASTDNAPWNQSCQGITNNSDKRNKAYQIEENISPTHPHSLINWHNYNMLIFGGGK